MTCAYCDNIITEEEECACRYGVRLCEDCWYVRHENECSIALEEGPLS